MRHITLLLFAFIMAAAVAAPPVTVFTEAETAAKESTAPRGADVWLFHDTAGASGGKVLYHSASLSSLESAALPLHIPQAGTYRIWVRSFRGKADLPVSAFTLIRDDATRVMCCHYLDWQSFIPTEKPYEKVAPRAAGFVWESFDVSFDRPMRATISFDCYRPGGATGERQIDCVLATTDLTVNPAGMDIARVPALATVKADAHIILPPAPRGFAWSPGAPVDVNAFAGIDDPDKRFWAGLINCGSVYGDGALMIHLGFNRDHNGISAPWGLSSMGGVMESISDPAFTKARPAPEGRFVNAQG